MEQQSLLQNRGEDFPAVVCRRALLLVPNYYTSGLTGFSMPPVTMICTSKGTGRERRGRKCPTPGRSRVAVRRSHSPGAEQLFSASPKREMRHIAVGKTYLGRKLALHSRNECPTG